MRTRKMLRGSAPTPAGTIGYAGNVTHFQVTHPTGWNATRLGSESACGVSYDGAMTRPIRTEASSDGRVRQISSGFSFGPPASPRPKRRRRAA